MPTRECPMIRRVRDSFLVLSPLFVVLAAWELYILTFPEKSFYIGSPTGIFNEFVILVKNGMFFVHFFVTFSEALIGFILGCTFGSIAGLLLWYSKSIQKIAKPYMLALGSIPIFALAPALIFWFGSGLMSKIILVFLSTFFVSMTQAFNGASVKKDEFEMLLKTLGANKNQLFLTLTVPSSLLWVLAGIRLNIGYSILGAFIGELISSQRGLGHLIMVAEGLYNINQIWVGIMGIVLIALIFSLLVSPLERWSKNKRLH